jgi:hypothetical protein
MKIIQNISPPPLFYFRRSPSRFTTRTASPIFPFKVLVESAFSSSSWGSLCDCVCWLCYLKPSIPHILAKDTLQEVVKERKGFSSLPRSCFRGTLSDCKLAAEFLEADCASVPSAADGRLQLCPTSSAPPIIRVDHPCPRYSCLSSSDSAQLFHDRKANFPPPPCERTRNHRSTCPSRYL